MTESPMCVIGIGAQKAGTTTVARELKRDPDFAFSAIKDLQYFKGKYFPKHAFVRANDLFGSSSCAIPSSGRCRTLDPQ